LYEPVYQRRSTELYKLCFFPFSTLLQTAPERPSFWSSDLPSQAVSADALYCATPLNMGCPAKTAANKGGGAALIRMPETAKEIIRAAQ
jgi:hypothetical protein